MTMMREVLSSLTQDPDSDWKIRTVPLNEQPFRISTSHNSATPTHQLSELPVALSPPSPGVHEKRDSHRASTPNDAPKQHTEDQSGVPAWLSIFFDLAWTTTFSNLTNNTQLTTVSTLFSYTIFFVLAWWLWAAQVTYDARYFRNDWFHRAMLLIQLTIFGSLSAFTSNFNPFSSHVDPKKSPLSEYEQDQYARKSMLGISALFACTRIFLILAYGRVFFYLRKKKESDRVEQGRRLLCHIAAYTCSFVLFSAAFAVVKLDRGRSAIPSRICLWLVGVAIEIMAYLTVPQVDSKFLLNVNTMGERLSTLTTIILGEGLNSLADALVMGASAIGFDAKSGGVAASSTVIITFSFLLYFDGLGLRDSGRFTCRRAKWNVMIHFVLHLSLIVLLEAMKNTLIYSSLFGVINASIDRIDHPKHGENTTEAEIAAARNDGVDLKRFMQQCKDAILAQNRTKPDPTLNMTVVNYEVVNKANGQLYLSIFSQFHLASDELRQNITDYIQTIGGEARADGKDGFSVGPILDAQVQQVQQSAKWIFLAGAIFLVCLGLLTLVNTWEKKHRYVWGSILSRWTMAIILSLLSLLNLNEIKWQRLQDEALLGAIVAIAFVVQFAVDYGLVVVEARRRKPRKTS